MKNWMIIADEAGKRSYYNPKTCITISEHSHLIGWYVAYDADGTRIENVLELGASKAVSRIENEQ